MDMLRIGIMGVAGTLLAVQFKSGKSEYGIYITVVLSLIIFFSILGKLQTIVDAMKGIGRFIQMDQAYIGTLIKIFGKLAVMILSMPILLTLLNTIRGFLS